MESVVEIYMYEMKFVEQNVRYVTRKSTICFIAFFIDVRKHAEY